MTLISLILYVAIGAAVLTAFIGFVLKKVDSYAISFLQNFAGLLFIVSGWVKVVDPLGTAYKMQDYFEQFELTFEATWLSFMAPLFPFLSEYAASFAIVVIIFEIILGWMLIIGLKRHWVAWLFFLLVLFFTILTGFTFLTGYVPPSENFFNFSAWQEYDPRHMRVTDCGCFGDFIKIEPRVSFLKDIFLLIPAVIFLFFWERKHQILTFKARLISTLIFTAFFFYYGLSNYVWNIPDFDFRPFKEGVNIYEKKLAEEEASNNVSIQQVQLEDRETGKVIELAYEDYLDVFSEYPKEAYEINYIYDEPAIEPSKLSEFVVYNKRGENLANQLLSQEGYSFIVVANALKGNISYEDVTIQDTLYVTDSIYIAGKDSPTLVDRVDTIIEKEESRLKADWNDTYADKFKSHVKPIMDKAIANGHESYLLAGKVNYEAMEDFMDSNDLPGEVYEADNILLKTMIRSNPGLILLHNGTIIKKWHWKQLEDYSTIKEKYLSE